MTMRGTLDPLTLGKIDAFARRRRRFILVRGICAVVTILLAVFGFLLLWTINVALSARDRVGATLCLGVAAMTFWHVVVNVAMVLGIAPVVGVTLPFISYGGSSLVVFLGAMGLVANVSLRKHGY